MVVFQRILDIFVMKFRCAYFHRPEVGNDLREGYEIQEGRLHVGKVHSLVEEDSEVEGDWDV